MLLVLWVISVLQFSYRAAARFPRAPPQTGGAARSARRGGAPAGAGVLAAERDVRPVRQVVVPEQQRAGLLVGADDGARPFGVQQGRRPRERGRQQRAA